MEIHAHRRLPVDALSSLPFFGILHPFTKWSADSMKTFGRQQRKRQHAFRDSSSTVSGPGRSPLDDKGKRNGHLLAVGYEDDNLYPLLREDDIARKFFAARGIKWWKSSRSGDNTDTDGPTRNMASSQIACVNFLLPLAGAPEALLAILREIDPDVLRVENLEYLSRDTGAPLSSSVDFEWVGLDSCLEGGPGTRGANTTSVDALMVGVTEAGVRRGYLFEWKYIEEYIGAEYLGDGKSGETRRRRYTERYASGDSRFNGKVPLEEFFYEPFYQIMRLGLLADKMAQDEEFGISEAKVVVVCPEGYDAYRETITSPALRVRAPNATSVEEVVQAALREPASFKITSPEKLVAAVRESDAEGSASDWLAYQHERYGY